MASLLPRYIAIQSFERVGYLSYTREGGEINGFLRFMEPQVTAPYAKFEVESSKTDGLVHIRSCQNNKYWQRIFLPSVPWGLWIVTKSKNREEDKSKESCTLFKFISVDSAENKFRIMHVQSGCYVCSWAMEEPQFNRGLLCYYNQIDAHNADVFKIVDWSSLMILPRHVAFKGDNDKYLCLYNDSMPYFGADDIGEPSVACEILPTNDGKIRIKSSKTGKFFRCVNSKWIWADDTSTDNVDTFFRAVKYEDKKIALISFSNNKFCKRLTADGYVSAIAAVITSATKEAEMMVEEPVLSREIYDVRYDVDNSRVYGEAVLVVAQNSAPNWSDNPAAMDVKLEYEDIKSRSWKTNLSLKLGMKTTLKFDVPFIFEGKFELSAEVQSGVEWGKDFKTATKLEVVHKVVVPAKSEVTVNLVATKGLCDVPFTYKQRDVLYDGSTVLSEVQGGTFYGSNYHRLKFETKAQKLPSGTKV